MTRRNKNRKRRPRRGIYLLPNLFTSASLFCGFLSITMAVEGRFQTAAVLIFASLILDGLDGTVARMTNSTSRFGVEYDSLADVVAFGVAPGFLAYSFALNQFGRLGLVAAFLYACCGALRLARFNVQVGHTDPRFFVGLPIPAAASTAAAVVLGISYFNLESKQVATGLLVLMYVLSFLQVSNLPYRSAKKLELRRYPSFNLLVAGVLLFSLFAYRPVLMALIFWLIYLASGPVLALIRLRLKSTGKEAIEEHPEPEGAGRQ